MRFAYTLDLLSSGTDGPDGAGHECRRSGHALALADGRVFAIGGGQFAATSPPVLQFDLAAGRWTLLNAVGDAPDADVTGCVAFADGCASLLAFGGRPGAGGACSGDLFRLDLRQHRWMRPPPVGPDQPSPRAGALACGIGHRLYLMSGHSDAPDDCRRLADLWQLDAALCRWTRLPDPPAEAAEAADCLVGVSADCLVAVGSGGCCWQFDLFTCRWSGVSVPADGECNAAAELRSRRLIAATSGSGSRLFALGQEGFVECLDACLATGWQPVSPAAGQALPIDEQLPRYLAAACSYTADPAAFDDNAGILLQGGLAWPSGRPLADLRLLRIRERPLRHC